MTFGEKLSQFRRLKGITQEALAKSIGISPTAYAQIERDESDIALSRITQIAKALGLNEWALFLPEGAINIIGEVKEGNLGIGNTNNQIIDFTHERQAFQNHLKALEKQILQYEKQIAQQQDIINHYLKIFLFCNEKNNNIPSE